MTPAKSVPNAPSRGSGAPYSGLAYDTRYFDTYSLSLLSVLVLIAQPLRAGDGIQVRWIEVCRVAGGNELTIKTLNGDTVAGYRVFINVDEIAARTQDKGVVKIARATLSRIDMQRSMNNGHQLRSLRKGMRQGLRHEFQ